MAQCDDGSCDIITYDECTVPVGCLPCGDPNANTNNPGCCSDILAENYDASATCDDGSCIDPPPPPPPPGICSIPDSVFEQKLISLGHDIGTPDGSIPTSNPTTGVNINTVTSLPVHGYGSWTNVYGFISDLTGIACFPALTELKAYNNELTSIDVSQNTALTYLHVGNQHPGSLPDSGLISLDLRNNPNLTTLYCWDNQLTSLDLRNGNNAGISLIHGHNQGGWNAFMTIYVDNIPVANAKVASGEWDFGNWAPFYTFSL